jgi:hypothetical protein
MAALLVCGALLVMFAALGWLAVRGKAPTADEPLHALGAWLAVHQGDHRLNFEDPALWHMLVSLPNGPHALATDLTTPSRRGVIGDHPGKPSLIVDLLYRTPGNDAHRLIARSRAAMLFIGIALGALLACWSCRVGGVACAVAATLLFVLDPTVLGHAALIKNDLAMSLVLLAVACAVWRSGMRLTLLNAAAVCIFCGVAVTTKFSGLLVGPVVAVLLTGRALWPGPWVVLGRTLNHRALKLTASMALCVAAACVTPICMWTAYGWRFTPTPDPSISFDFDPLVTKGLMKRFIAQGPLDATPGEIRRTKPEQTQGMVADPLTRSVLWANERRLLPQAWLYGLLYTHQSAFLRQNYLLGEYSLAGWWYYFPAAMLVKSPLATLLASALAAALGIVALRTQTLSPQRTWLAACLVVPPAIYMAAAMASSMNIGIRHILPVYPFMFMGIGLSAAWLWARARRLAMGLGLVLALGLAAEALAAFPNYIAFFNTAARPNRLYLLGDSNLDWAQDLTLLADWHRRHPDVELYVSFFTPIPPSAYGLSDYHNVLLANPWGPPPEQVSAGPGRVLAISATNLQGIYAPDRELRDGLRRVRELLDPIEVLGGTVYLYDLNTPAAHRLFGASP